MQRGLWMTLTFHKIWTPSCFCPSRAVWSLHNSTFAVFMSHHPFCWLNIASLEETASVWGEGRKEKPNHKTNAQQTAAVQFQMGTSSTCRSPQGNVWVDLSEENGLHHLALLFLSEQEHSRSSRGRWGSCCWRCPWGCVFRGQPAVNGWQYPKGILTLQGALPSQAVSYPCLSVLNLSPSFLWPLPWKVF